MMIPKLGVPTLSQSLERFLATTRPLQNAIEFAQTDKMVKTFETTTGPYLQEKLLKLSKEEDNWASYVWVHTRFLSDRSSLLFSNATSTYRTKIIWSTLEDKMKSISQYINYFLKIFDKIRNGQWPQEKNRDIPICMDQLRRVICHYRQPGFKVDTHCQSTHSNHIIIMHAGNTYKVPVYDANTNQLVSIQQIYSVVSHILTSQLETPGISTNLSIGLLTSLPRDECYVAMQEMRLSSVNANSLKIVEESMFGICIDSLSAGTMENVLKFCRLGDHTENFKYFNRWFGLGLEIAFTNDGYLALITEHSLFDGTVVSIFDDIFSFQKEKDIELNSDTEHHSKPELLKWEISPAIQLKIEEAKATLTKLLTNYDVTTFDFTDFGKDFLMNHGVYFLGFVALAIQLTYYKLYNRIAASYQPVSLRLFHCGRLEQVPTLTSESLAFIESITSKSSELKRNFTLMKLAIAKYKELMTSVSRGEVYIKHLQALKMLADREQLDVELFNSNFFTNIFAHYQLATSLTYSTLPVVGAFINQDQTGHFVSFHPMKDNIHFSICTMKTSDCIPSEQFGCELNSTLNEMKHFIISQHSSGPAESKL